MKSFCIGGGRGASPQVSEMTKNNKMSIEMHTWKRFFAPVPKEMLVQKKIIGAKKNETRIGSGPDLLFS